MTVPAERLAEAARVALETPVVWMTTQRELKNALVAFDAAAPRRAAEAAIIEAARIWKMRPSTANAEALRRALQVIE